MPEGSALASASTAQPSPSDPAVARALAEAQLAKAQADARKAGAEADTAASSAKTTALKAILGDLPAPPNPGAVTASDKAALAEHNELARRALRKVADQIAARALPVLKGSNVYVTAEDGGPNRAADESFALQKQLVSSALDGAVGLSRKLDPDARPASDDAADSFTLAAVGLVLSGLNTVLSYARTDWNLGGREFTLGERVLVTAVAEVILASGKRVRFDGPCGGADAAVRDGVITELSAVSQSANEARERAGRHAAMVKKLSPPPAPKDKDADPPAPDPDPKNQRPLHEHALQALTSAIKLYEEFEAALLAVTDGVSGIQRVARARALSEFLMQPGSAILVVKLDGVFGSSLDEKNVWTSITGKIPYLVSVLVDASWRCFDPESLLLLGSGLTSWYIPFTELGHILRDGQA